MSEKHIKAGNGTVESSIKKIIDKREDSVYNNTNAILTTPIKKIG